MNMVFHVRPSPHLRQPGAVDSWFCVAKERDPQSCFDQLVQAEQEVRARHDELTHQGWDAVRALVQAELGANESEATGLRLYCLARLVGEFDEPEAVDGLIDLLAAAYGPVRAEAGEQLQGLAVEDFSAVAEGAKRAVERLPVGSPALSELPYMLVETDEPGLCELFGRLLEQPDADGVAATIEALVQLGDPVGIELLEPLREDQRMSTLGEEPGETFEAKIGELAGEAAELLAHLSVVPPDGERP